jgi:TatD DNase family protein
LVETDAPYQAPSGRPPGHNEPAYLVDIVAAVARARSEAADDVARYTEENAYRLFRIPRPFG